MKAFKIQITAFISDDQPGFVEARFTDAWEREHQVQDKALIFTKEYLDRDSAYPQEGVIACEMIREWIDQANREIVTVTTERPWAVETVEGLTEFDLIKEQLIELDR